MYKRSLKDNNVCVRVYIYIYIYIAYITYLLIYKSSEF